MGNPDIGGHQVDDIAEIIVSLALTSFGEILVDHRRRDLGVDLRLLPAPAVPSGIAQYIHHLGGGEDLPPAVELEGIAAVPAGIIQILRQSDQHAVVEVGDDLLQIGIGNHRVMVDFNIQQLGDGLLRLLNALPGIQLKQTGLLRPHRHIGFPRQSQRADPDVGGIYPQYDKALRLTGVLRYDQQVAGIRPGIDGARHVEQTGGGSVLAAHILIQPDDGP